MSASRSGKHTFGTFNVKGIKVVDWRLPPNRDDDCRWGFEE